jgi:hypothetical protein
LKLHATTFAWKGSPCLHLLRKHHRLGHDLLREGQRARDVVEIGAAVLGGLRAERAFPAVWRPSVSMTIRLAWPGGRLARASWIALEQIGGAAANVRLRSIHLALVRERLVDDGLLAEDDHALTIAALHVLRRLGDEAPRALTRGQAHAVGVVEQEDDVEAVDPARDRGAHERQAQEHEQDAAQRQRDPIAVTGRQPHAPGALAPPVEQRLEEEERHRDPPRTAATARAGSEPGPRLRPDAGADAGRGRVARFDSSASARFTATRISPRAVVNV